MSRIVRWDTPFTDAFYPNVVLLATTSRKGIISVKAIVAPGGMDKYPKFLVDFGEVIVFTSMEEACCPERDFDSAIDETLEGKNLCAFQYFDSPWLKSYEGCFDPYSEGKYFHYMIFGGDNDVEIITQNVPIIKVVEQEEVLIVECEI